MSVLGTAAKFRRGIYKSERIRRLARWFNALPHPSLAIEIAPERVSLVRWSHAGSVEEFAVEPLRPGILSPSAVETNIVDLAALQSAVKSACKRLHGVQESHTALLLPDPVIRVFVQHFEEFPRSPEDAFPLLRWRLRKSVPFDAEEMQLSYARQAPRDNGVNVVTAVARLPIVKEYEDAVRAASLRPGVVLSSSIAALALLDDDRPTLMVRIAGNALTTVIARGGILCAYRCTELPVQSNELNPKALLDEVFPVTAYYQDTWQEKIQSVVVAGLGARLSEFLPLLEAEFHCPVHSLLRSAIESRRVPGPARCLADRDLEGLLGWMWYRA